MNCPYCPTKASTSAACGCVCHGTGLTQGHYIPSKEKDCDCSGPYTCKLHEGSFDYCDNLNCKCHKKD
ncbi:hypothetical protein M0R04_06470 [Candidatus Dojkabacteria bacterium]|jgi:hypothetical protein|nr:hypothetical protein [Candidatus Dojkabacteria bacterium]